MPPLGLAPEPDRSQPSSASVRGREAGSSRSCTNNSQAATTLTWATCSQATATHPQLTDHGYPPTAHGPRPPTHSSWTTATHPQPTGHGHPPTATQLYPLGTASLNCPPLSSPPPLSLLTATSPAPFGLGLVPYLFIGLGVLRVLHLQPWLALPIHVATCRCLQLLGRRQHPGGGAGVQAAASGAGGHAMAVVRVEGGRARGGASCGGRGGGGGREGSQ